MTDKNAWVGLGVGIATTAAFLGWLYTTFPPKTIIPLGQASVQGPSRIPPPQPQALPIVTPVVSPSQTVAPPPPPPVAPDLVIYTVSATAIPPGATVPMAVTLPDGSINPVFFDKTLNAYVFIAPPPTPNSPLPRGVTTTSILSLSGYPLPTRAGIVSRG